MRDTPSLHVRAEQLNEKRLLAETVEPDFKRHALLGALDSQAACDYIYELIDAFPDLLAALVLRAGEQTTEETRWQPIETAPKDGTLVLVFDEGLMVVSHWFDDEVNGKSGWWDSGIMEPPPQSWMPLPTPPSQPPTTGETT